MCGRFALYSPYPKLSQALRMPLALDAESLEPWLDPHLTDRETIRHVVHHLAAELLTQWPVSTRVNRPGNDNASLIVPA